MKVKATPFFLALSLVSLCLQLGGAPAHQTETVPLTQLTPDSAEQGWGTLRINRGVLGQPMKIGDRTFSSGLGTHAASQITYTLEEGTHRFEAWVGVDAALGPTNRGTIIFQVYGDDKQLFDSGLMTAKTPVRRVSVGLEGVRTLKLVVTDGGDGRDSDHANWAEPVLLMTSQSQEGSLRVAHEIRGGGLTVALSKDGRIVGIRSGKFKQPLAGLVSLTGLRAEGPVQATKLQNGGISFARRLSDGGNRRCMVTEQFTPQTDAVGWTVEIVGEGEPWTAPIVTRLSFPNGKALRFWSAWADPEGVPDGWRDPLEAQPFSSSFRTYGNMGRAVPVGGDYISIPVSTFIDPQTDQAVSLILSPEDVLLNLTLGWSADGDVRWTRSNYRLGAGRPVRFNAALVTHEADCRGALRYLVTHHSGLFDPPNPRVHGMAGCGAYSGDERPVDVDKFKKMSFKINWKLSDDFAYMGMFIPPVKSPQERWRRSCDEPMPPGKNETTSCEQQNAYGRWMKENGFHLLNYFNVTEFGKNMQDRDVEASMANDPELWKDPVAFAKLTFPGAIYEPKQPRMYYGAWLVDIGDPEFRKFMLEQARRHIELLPDTDGICIDRMDWLRCYNGNADDGVSWVNGKPARSMLRSWIGFMEQLGPLMHRADKVIFGNTMSMRLELNRHLDGIYTEQGHVPGALNTAALMGVRKPVLSWTANQSLNNPDPDTFFQRLLYLGVYPTAPYPGNHHSITPDPKFEQPYMEYGRLMDAMRGRKWVLTPRAVSSMTPGVKVNLFEVPNGYVVPVMLAGEKNIATVLVKGLPGMEKASATALHPGSEAPVQLKPRRRGGSTELQVPLQRGCAMVVLKPSAWHEVSTTARKP